MENGRAGLVIFQNFFTPARHKLFVEIAKYVTLTVIYLQKPQDEGRKWTEDQFGKDKNYMTVQFDNRKVGPFIISKNIDKILEYITPDSFVVFLDNLPTNYSMFRFMTKVSRVVPRKNRALWVEHISPRGDDSWLKTMYKRLFTIFLSLRVDTVIAFSALTSEYLTRLNIPLSGQKVIREYQATYTKAEIEHFKEESEKLRTKERKILVFGLLGYLSKRKGLEEILAAMKYYKNEKARFLFVGDGPDKNLIEAAAKTDDRIKLVPYAVTEEEKTEYLSAMDVHVVASYRDPWVLVVNEAASRGTPSLISPYAGAKEMMKEVNDEFLLKDISAISLAKGFTVMEKMFTDKELWTIMREKTYRVASEWNIERAAEIFVNLVKIDKKSE